MTKATLISRPQHHLLFMRQHYSYAALLKLMATTIAIELYVLLGDMNFVATLFRSQIPDLPATIISKMTAEDVRSSSRAARNDGAYVAAATGVLSTNLISTRNFNGHAYVVRGLFTPHH